MVLSEVLTEVVEALDAVPEVVAETVVVADAAPEAAVAEAAAAARVLEAALTMLPTPGGLGRPGIRTCLLGGPVKNISFGGSQLTGVRNPILVLGKNSPHPRTKIETGTSPL